MTNPTSLGESPEGTTSGKMRKKKGTQSTGVSVLN